MWVTLPAFHSGSPSTYIAEAVSEVHVGIFFISVSVRRFDYPTVLQHNTPTSRDSVQACFNSTWLGNSYKTNFSESVSQSVTYLLRVTNRTVLKFGHYVCEYSVNFTTWSIKGEFPFMCCWFQMPFFMVNCWVSTESTKHRPCCVFLLWGIS